MPSIWERPEFIAYCKRIREIIGKSSEPQSIADIHRRLNPDVRREWTLDAIEWLDDVDSDGKIPARYYLRNAPARQRKNAYNQGSSVRDKYAGARPERGVPDNGVG